MYVCDLFGYKLHKSHRSYWKPKHLSRCESNFIASKAICHHNDELNKAHNKFNCMNCYANYGSLFQWRSLKLLRFMKMAAFCLNPSHILILHLCLLPLSNLTNIIWLFACISLCNYSNEPMLSFVTVYV